MVFRRTWIKFDNERTLTCQKILFCSDEFVAILTGDDTYEVYNCMGEKITPHNCTYIAKGIRNQLIIGLGEIYQVY